MPFHFKKSESATENIRRLATERIDNALARFDDKRDLMEAIHCVRKDIKKLRAIFRLVRQSIGEKAYHREADTLRDAAGKLADVRDAKVKLEMFEKLMEHFETQLSPKAFSKIKATLVTSCRKESERFVKNSCAKEVKKSLKKIADRTAARKVPNSWKSFQPGLKTSYGGGRDCFFLLKEKPCEETFHEWRKKVKDLWYHLSLFCPIWPPILESTIDELDELAEYLGDVHDLIVLKEQLMETRVPGTSATDLETFFALTESRKHELQAKALSSGARLYAEKPSAFCKRIECYWAVWKTKAG